MFGMGFMEILIIGIIAVIFLGPDKLPETMVNIAKFFRSIKSTVASAKDSLEQEMHISELKQEALSYKNELMSANNELEKATSMANLDEEMNSIKETISHTTSSSPGYHEDNVVQKPAYVEEEPAVTFKKKEKSKAPKADENAEVSNEEISTEQTTKTGEDNA